MSDDLVFRLRERARIRRSISSRKSVQFGEPDRISDLLEEAAERIDGLEGMEREVMAFLNFPEPGERSLHE